MYAEDQMVSTEIVQLLAQELIELYRDKHATIRIYKTQISSGARKTHKTPGQLLFVTVDGYPG